MEKKLKPAKRVAFQPGKIITHGTASLACLPDGRLKIEQGIAGFFISFSVRERMAIFLCHAGVKNGEVFIFQGDEVGPGMLNEKEIKSFLGV